jgi:hypothetical protein
MADWLMDNVISWLAKAVLACFKAIWDLLAQTAFTTPDVTTLPQVTAFSGRSLVVVNAAFVLAIIAAGVAVMTHETIQVRYGIGDLLPRLVVGFVAANFATPICKNLIDLANALTQALTGDGIDSKDSFAHMQRVIVSALGSEEQAFLLVIIGLIIAVLSAMLLVVFLIRVAVLVVLVGIAPVALACHALPYTDAAARLWWRAMLVCLGTVMLQALTMHTALSIFLDPNANAPLHGIPNDPNGTLNLFIVACLLWATVKIPGLMRRYVSGGGSSNMVGAFLRVVVVQQLTRGLGTALRGRRVATAMGAGAAGQHALAATTPISYWRPRLPDTVRGHTAAAGPASAGPSTTGPTAANTSAEGAANEAASQRPRKPVLPSQVMPKKPGAWRVKGHASGTGWPATRPRPATAAPIGRHAAGMPSAATSAISPPATTSPPPRSAPTPAPTPALAPRKVSGTGWPARAPLPRPYQPPRRPRPSTGGSRGR